MLKELQVYTKLPHKTASLMKSEFKIIFQHLSCFVMACRVEDQYGRFCWAEEMDLWQTKREQIMGFLLHLTTWVISLLSLQM